MLCLLRYWQNKIDFLYPIIFFVFLQQSSKRIFLCLLMFLWAHNIKGDIYSSNIMLLPWLTIKCRWDYFDHPSYKYRHIACVATGIKTECQTLFSKTKTVVFDMITLPPTYPTRDPFRRNRFWYYWKWPRLYFNPYRNGGGGGTWELYKNLYIYTHLLRQKGHNCYHDFIIMHVTMIIIECADILSNALSFDFKIFCL